MDRNLPVKEVDGSVMEGGGQVVRISVALSCLLEQPIRLIKIRAGRASPGLKPQHIAGISLVREMCNGILSGIEHNSSVLCFKPLSLRMGNFNSCVNTKTAASISLLIQAALPSSLFSNRTSTITMKGGTDVNFAPPIDFVKHVLFPLYNNIFGLYGEVHITKRGYYPNGGGEVKLTIVPIDYNGNLKPILLNDFGYGFECAIKAFICISGLPNEDAKKQEIVDSAGVLIKSKLDESGYFNVTIEGTIGNSLNFGGSIVLVANTGKCIIGSAIVYDVEKTVSDNVKNVCDKLLLDLTTKSCVDANTLDHLIIFMGLANGKSIVRCREITLHTKTAIHYVQLFTNAKFTITKMEGGLFEIVCEGIGFKRRF